MVEDQDTPNQKDIFLLEHAIDALEKTTGIIGRIIAPEPEIDPDMRADAAIEINAEGNLHEYLVEIKRIDRFAAIGQIKNQLGRFQRPGLLVAPRITTETADKCRELDVQFIDTNGNAYLHAPGLYVLVKGQRTKANEDFAGGAINAPRGGTTTALKVVFALLCRPGLINAPYREISQTAGVALGAIGWVFNDLNTRGYTTRGRKKGDHYLLERKRLIDEWVTNFPIMLRPKLNTRRFDAAEPDWWRKVNIAEYGAQWGGEVAADRLTNHLRPNAQTIYMQPDGMNQNLQKMVVENRLRAATDGKIEILKRFWNFPPDQAIPDIVPPLLVYADLLATMDPRNFEVAQMIYEKSMHDPEAIA